MCHVPTRRFLTLALLLFSYATALLAQGVPTFESVSATTIALHRGAGLTGVTVQLTGAITYPSLGSRSFTLGAQRDLVRMDVAGPDGVASFVRQGERIQVARSGHREAPDSSTLSTSPLNFTPLPFLLALKNSERFSGSLTVGEDGRRYLRFTEIWPARFQPPPFPQPGQIIQFELASDGRIARVQHGRTDLEQWRFGYDYTYAGLAAAPFLQPSRIVGYSDGRTFSTVDVTSVSSGVVLTGDYFRIYEPGKGN